MSVDRAAKYWNRVHRSKSRRHLSCHSLDDHVRILDLGTYFDNGHGWDILCVGSGDGAWVTEMAAQGHNPSVLDISPIALSRFPDFSTYADATTLPEDAFDLVMSLWVTPHVDAPAFDYQLRGVLPSLRLTGLFSMMYCSPEYGRIETDCAPNTTRSPGHATMLRRPETIRRLVGDHGGKVQRDFLLSEDPEYKLYARCAWITRESTG